MYRQEETETNRIKETHILYKHTHTHVYDFTEMQNSMTELKSNVSVTTINKYRWF